MKKIHISFLIVSFGLTSLFAQSPKEVLDQVSSAYQAAPSLYIQFLTTLSNKAAKTSDQYEGEVYAKGSKYALKIPDMDILQLFDGKRLASISKETKEVTLTQPEPAELLTPTKVLSVYKKGYALTWEKTGKTEAVIVLTPTEKSQAKKIRITVNPSTKQLLEVEEITTQGTSTKLKVLKQQKDILIPEALLTYDPSAYKGYYISEL